MVSGRNDRQGAAAELSAVRKKYDMGTASPVDVLDGVDLTVGQGEAVAITGPSGSGKTTLLNIMGTLDDPDEGMVTVLGQDVEALSMKALADFRNRHIGFIFQLHHLLPHLTVLENILVPTMFSPSADVKVRARALLDEVGLSDRLDHRPGQLSVGQMQRVAVVRALVNNPELLLADEPTGSLDHEGATGLADLLFRLVRKERVGMVLVTHSLELASRADRVLTLADGKLAVG